MRSLAGRISLRRKQVRHAITDLYDEERRTFLIQYPVWLIVALGLTGVIAFAVTGFWGPEIASPFGKPIVLLLVFWLFSLALAGFNLLLIQVKVVDGNGTQPFLPLGITTYASLAALVIYGALTLLRRARASAEGATGVEVKP